MGGIKMTLDERIKYAEQKLDEACQNDGDIRYWVGYIDGLRAAKRSLDG
jgi:hypothetical protein